LKSGADRRSSERLRHHYEVEKEIADRLKATRDRAERAPILATMYEELFARVPDHPRLTVQRDPQAEAQQVRRLLALLAPHLRRDIEYVEFGAGACALAFAVCPSVRRVRVVEIADQIPSGVRRPGNFELVLYDGGDPGIAPDSVDVVFSEQFVEHLHPDDAVEHFGVVHRMLRSGGRYVLRTPERWTGPHDVSRWFAATPQGFHLREWSYADLVHVGRQCGYRQYEAAWQARGICVHWPLSLALAVESIVARLPRGWRRTLGHKLVPMVTLTLVK
jgi:SAM-dependent methyltransferase